MPIPSQEGEVSAELERYTLLFDGLFTMTSDWLDRAPSRKLDWVPSDDEIHRFGDGKTSVTLRNLYIHVAVAEHVWFNAVASLPDGSDAPFPSNPTLSNKMRDGDLKAEAELVHRSNMLLVRELGSAQLDKSIIFSKRNWSGIEFLWGIYAHRAFHLGHIDLYLRMNGQTTPEFFVFHPTKAP